LNSDIEMPLDFKHLFPKGSESLKKLILTKSHLEYLGDYFDNLNMPKNELFSMFPNLEHLDLSQNKFHSNFYIDRSYISFGKSHKIKKIILTNNEINVIFELPYFIKPGNSGNEVFANYELLDISENYIEPIVDLEILKKTFLNLKIKIENAKLKKIRLVVRMLFSRSGVSAENNNNKEDNINKNIKNKIKAESYCNKKSSENLNDKEALKIGNGRKNFSNGIYFDESKTEMQEEEFVFSSYPKFMGKKTNGAVLPCIVYDCPSKINIDKPTLIEILKTENKLRLSDFAKSAYDENWEKDKNFHLNLDLYLIKRALTLSGFSPQTDDSLKAYHLATKKFIADPEVMDSVVWMKYDKCKIGKYSIGDKPDFKNIKICDIYKNEFLLKNLICNDHKIHKNHNNNKIFNLIVSGSLS